MGLVSKRFLDVEDSSLDTEEPLKRPPVKVWGCKNCKTHLATSDGIISKNFQGQYGRCWLLSNVVNVTTGELEERSMTTGVHSVRDIYCHCNRYIGWYYEKCFEESQRYKEGHYILERNLLIEIS